MSFILDALKKSERERQRQTGPALFEVKVAPPRNRFPVWAVVIGALLIVNSGVIIWLLIHYSSKGGEAQAVAPGAVAAAPVASANAGNMGAGPMNAGQTPYGQPPMGQTQWQPGPPPPYTANANMPPSGSGGEYFGDPAGMSSGRPEQSQNEPPPASDASDEPRLKNRLSEDQTLNPEDYEPAREIPRASRSATARKQAADEGSSKSESAEETQQARKAEKGLPTYQDAAAMPGMNMPALRLDLHVYDPEPDKSFVLVNMQKVKPGETFAQGVHVDQITPSGAILSYRGVRFLLHSE